MPEIDNTKKNALRNYYSAAGVPQAKIDNLIGQLKNHNHSDFSDFINMSGDANTVFNAAERRVSDRNNKIISVVKNTDITEKFREAIVEVIKQKLVPHIKDFSTASADPSRYADTSVPCALKAFTIEYAAKALHALSSTEGVSDLSLSNNRFQTNNYLAKTLCNVLREDYSGFMAMQDADIIDLVLGRNLSEKERIEHIWGILNGHVIYNIKSLPEVLNVTGQSKILGHEIENMVNGLPKNIAALISYKDITYHANPSIAKRGSLPTEEHYLGGADLTLMNHDEYLTEEDFKQQKKKLSQNTNAFVELRYLERLVQEGDYQSLSTLSAATQTVLDFVLKHPELARKDITATSSVWGNFFTPDEMTHLAELQTNNPSFDQENLYYYYAFLKTYIGSRQLDFNDKKYQNINKLFEMIKSADNITALENQYMEWFKGIDPYSFSKEELKELEGIFPKQFFSALSYTDKHVYKLCKTRNIPFEFYYKSNYESLQKIYELCGPDFQNQSIPAELLFHSPETIEKYYSTISRLGLSLADAPSYYFRFTPQEIAQAHLERHTPSFSPEEISMLEISEEDLTPDKYISQDELTKMRINNKARQAMDDEGINAHMPQDELNWAIQGIHQTEAYKATQEKLKLVTRNANIIRLRALLANGSKTKTELLQEGYTSDEIALTVMIQRLEQTTKLTTEQLLGWSDVKIREIYATAYPRAKKQYINGHTLENAGRKPLSENRLHGARATNTYLDIKEMMDRVESIKPGMKYLNPSEAVQSYLNCRVVIPDIEPGEYLLYKTSDEVNQIVSKAQDDFLPEMLYMDKEVLNYLTPQFIKKHIERMRRGQGNLATAGSILDYDTTTIINENLLDFVAEKKESEQAKREYQEALAVSDRQHKIVTTGLYGQLLSMQTQLHQAEQKLQDYEHRLTERASDEKNIMSPDTNLETAATQNQQKIISIDPVLLAKIAELKNISITGINQEFINNYYTGQKQDLADAKAEMDAMFIMPPVAAAKSASLSK